jgi:hypothetical protein
MLFEAGMRQTSLQHLWLHRHCSAFIVAHNGICCSWTLLRSSDALPPALSACNLSLCLLLCLQQGGGSGLAALLGPQRLASLLPKLYRLCHDPSPKVSLMLGDFMQYVRASALLCFPHAAS